jgi:predicted aspartyl protease
MRLSRTIGFIALLPTMLCAPTIGTAQTTMPSAAKAKGKVVDSLPNHGEITLFQSNNRVMVMMRIGDGDLVPMIFDTGSDGHSIDRTIAKRERFKKVGTAIEVDGTTGKERKLPFVAMAKISIGGLRVGTIEASVLDYDRNDAMGIITSEMFTNSLLYLDLANGRARLVPREGAELPPGPATPYVRDIPSTDIVMPDGSKLPAHFDTGYNAPLSLPIAMMDKVPLIAPARVVGRFKSINTEGEVYGGRIRGTIRIGPVVLENPEVSFLGDLANIGLPVIRQVTLVIDPMANRDWVLPSGAVPGAKK